MTTLSKIKKPCGIAVGRDSESESQTIQPMPSRAGDEQGVVYAKHKKGLENAVARAAAFHMDVGAGKRDSSERSDRATWLVSNSESESQTIQPMPSRAAAFHMDVGAGKRDSSDAC